MLVVYLLLPKKKDIYMTFFSLHYFIDNQKKIRYNTRNGVTSYKKKSCEIFANSKKVSTFASAIEKQTLEKQKKRKRFKEMMARSSIG